MLVCDEHKNCIILYDEDSCCPICERIGTLEDDLFIRDESIENLEETIDNLKEDIKEKEEELRELRRENEELISEKLQLEDKINGLIV